MDTFTINENLIEADYKSKQEEELKKIANTFAKPEYVTKADVADMATKLDIAELKTGIAELKSDIAALRSELKSDIARLDKRISELKVQMFIFGSFATALIIAAVGFFSK